MTRWFLAAVILVSGCGPSAAPRAGPATVAPPTQGASSKQIVRLTRAAATKVREMRPAELPYLRVGVVGGGITGFQYTLRMDDTIDPEKDHVDRSGGDLTVLVDRLSAIYLEGSTIDWQKTADGREGFSFDNPNAVKTKPGGEPSP